VSGYLFFAKLRTAEPDSFVHMTDFSGFLPFGSLKTGAADLAKKF
jgi:hypothetical protein